MRRDNQERPLWRSPKAKWLLGIPLGGFVMFVLGAAALLAFHGTLEFTNSNQFCYSCHVGRDTIVEEYEASRHFNPPSGVQATCADCHVPKEFLPKMKMKIIALKDVYHQLAGTVNLENFESLRLGQAEHVWEFMRETDSGTCRSCHDTQHWNLERQSARARLNHDQAKWQERGETCIDCHYGIAHKRPSVAESD